jgi:hypothetical protein
MASRRKGKEMNKKGGSWKEKKAQPIANPITFLQPTRSPIYNHANDVII